jgi:hypothetical protein
MIILPVPIPKRLIVVGHMPPPGDYALVHAEQSPFKAAAYCFEQIGAGFQGRCTCMAKSWFTMFYVKCVQPDTPIMIVERPGDFLDWLITSNSMWDIIRDIPYAPLDPSIGDRLNTPVGA